MDCLCFRVAKSPKQTSVAARRKPISHSTPVARWNWNLSSLAAFAKLKHQQLADKQKQKRRPSECSPLSVVQRGVRCDLSWSAEPQLSSVRRGSADGRNEKKNTSWFETSIKQDAGFWYRCHFGLVYLWLFFFSPLWLCSVLLMNAAGGTLGDCLLLQLYFLFNTHWRTLVHTPACINCWPTFLGLFPVDESEAVVTETDHRLD